MKNTNFGAVATSYARSRNDIPNSLFESLVLRNILFEGKKVADIAAGTGALTRKIRLRKAHVIGVEPSEELIAEAKKISESRYEDIPFLKGSAEQTGLDDESIDIITVMRAWHWFDREAALQEMTRILKTTGTLIVADSGFIPGHPVVEETLRLLKKYKPDGLKPAGSKADSKQRINGFPAEWFGEWDDHGFALKDFYKLDYSVTFTNAAWIDRVASLSWLAEMEQDKRQQALTELQEVMDSQFGTEDTHTIPHTCQVCILNWKR